MNSLYDLCDYGYKIKDILKLKKCGIDVRDICTGKKNNKYKCDKLYYNAQRIFRKHNNVFKRDSIYELYEYGISAAIIDSIRLKVTIQDFRNYSDKDLKERYNIKYSTILKIRKCGYFNDILKYSKNDNEKDEIVKLKDYGVTQASINKILYNDIQLNELLSWNIDVIIKKLNISNPTACKLENALERYRIKNNIRKPLKKALPEYLQSKSKYSYINIEKIYNEFQDYDKKEIEDTLEELVYTGIIKKKDILYRYNFLQLKTIIGLIKEEKLKDMVNLKLQGKNFQEIGDKYRITRERARQIVGKFIFNNIVQEDIYKNIVEEYNFSKNEFLIIFESSGEVYEYLKYKYGKYGFGEKTIEEFLENYPEYFNEEKNEKLLAMNKEIIYNNCKIKLNYTEIIKAYVKKIKQQKNLKDILKELNMDFEKLELQPINGRYLEERLAKIDNVICGAGRKYKYFDYINISEEKRVLLQNMLNKLPDGYYSTLKLFKENESFFKSINIADEYEVHNLLRKLYDGKISKVTFSMMPSFLIGDVDVEPFFFELIKQYEPIDMTEFLNIVEKRYGHKKNHVRNILKKYFDNYITLEKINIKTLEFNEKEIILIKQKMKKELYNIESFYNILKQFYKDKYLEYINNTNLNKLRISRCRKLYIR